MEPIQVWAHRGASGEAPENTLEAFALAVDQGADGIELDVHLTLDGEVVVAHDETVQRVSDGAGRIAQMTLAQLKTFNFHRSRPRYVSLARIPTLQEVLAFIAPTRLVVNIELKNNIESYTGLEKRCAQLIERAGMRGRVWISSFNHDSLKRMKAVAPWIPCGALYDAQPDAQPWRYARRLGIEALHPYYKLLQRNEDEVAACREAGVRLHPWTVDDATDVRALARLGVDAIITNYPARVLRELGR